MGIIGCSNVTNYYHFVFNNSAHDSVGGQPTIGKQIDFKKLAKANSYKSFLEINAEADFEQLEKTFQSAGPVLIEIKIRKGARTDLGRPTSTPIENKILFKAFIQK